MELFVFGYFLVGSFSLLVVLASVIESCSFLFAHNPVVLETLGVVTIVTAMLSLSKPIGSKPESIVITDSGDADSKEVASGKGSGSGESKDEE